MKLLAALAVALVVLHFFPGVVTALVGAVGALAVAASAQPACWAFAAGVLAANRHHTRPVARTTPGKESRA